MNGELVLPREIAAVSRSVVLQGASLGLPQLAARGVVLGCIALANKFSTILVPDTQ